MLVYQIHLNSLGTIDVKEIVVDRNRVIGVCGVLNIDEELPVSPLPSYFAILYLVLSSSSNWTTVSK